MKERLLSILYSLGLTKNEALVYLAGLRLGPCTINAISTESGVKRIVDI